MKSMNSMINKYIVYSFLTVIFSCQQAQAQICTPSPPATSGCSTNGLQYLSPEVAIYKSIFRNQCNAHDTCYGTLGKDRETCDGSFRNAMRSQCDSSFNRWLAFPLWEACRNIAAEGFYRAVRSFGGPSFIQDKSSSSVKSAQVGRDVNQNKCGTTPQLTALYGSELLSYVTGSFGVYTSRAPTTYEFFDAINAYDPAGDPLTWRIAVDQYAKTHLNITPPAAGYTVTQSDSTLTLTASPNIPGIIYQWHINNQITIAASVTFDFRDDSYHNINLSLRGFLTAQSSNGARNVVVIDKTYVKKGECPNQVWNCRLR